MYNFKKSMVKIGTTKKIVVQVQQKETQKYEPKQYHHIHIIDRSISMQYNLDDLIDNVLKTLNYIPANDLLSVIWFSSQGQYKTVIKGKEKGANIKSIKNTLNGLRSVLGTTCFSDPIKEVSFVIDEIYDKCENISITFFTDGHPVIPWTIDEERRKIFKSLNHVKDKVISINTIGYGNYYNRELLQEIADVTEYGRFFHSQEINEYQNIFEGHFDILNDTCTSSIAIEHQKDIVYLGNNFTKLSPKQLKLSRLDKETNSFYLVGGSKDFTFTIDEEEYKSSDITEVISKDDIETFLYAYAYNLFYNGKRLACFDIVAKNLRDKKLADTQMSSFASNEVANYENIVYNCIFDKTARHIDGKCSANYLPKHNAHCVMDVMLTLSENDSYYIPYHKEAEAYTRIGRKVVDTENRFVKSDKPVTSNFDNFVFAKDKLNLSIAFMVNGKVKLNPKAAKRAGLDVDFPSQIHRTHTVIKNGALNMNTIVVGMNKNICNSLKKLGTTVTEFTDNPKDYGFDKDYVIAKIDLASLPIINRTYIEKVTMAKVFTACQELLENKAYQKCLNFYLKKIYAACPEAKQEKVFKSFNDIQIRVLEDHGIDKYGNYVGINNKMKSSAESDSYEIRKMTFTFKGFSSLPSLKDVEKKLKANKSLTPSQDLLYRSEQKLIKLIEAKHGTFTETDLSIKELIEAELKIVKRAIKKQNYWLSGLKIAKVLTCDWFVELTNVDKKGNYVFEQDEKVLLVKSEKAVEYI